MKSHKIVIITTLLFLSSCSKNIHISRFEGDQLNKEAVQFLIQDVVTSVRNWRKGIVKSMCVPGPEMGIYDDIFEKIESIEEFKIVEYELDDYEENFHGNKDIGIRNLVELFLREKNNEHNAFSITILTIDGKCVSYEVGEIIED